MRIAIFSYYSFRLAVIKYWTHKLLTLNLNLLKSNKYTQRILHVITGVNEGWLVFEKVIPFTFSSLFGIIRSNTFWLGMWLIYKITVCHNFLGVHMLYKSLYGREVEASQTWLCSNQLWSMGKKKKKKSCLVPTCGDPDVTGVMWRLGSDVFNMFHKWLTHHRFGFVVKVETTYENKMQPNGRNEEGRVASSIALVFWWLAGSVLLLL